MECSTTITASQRNCLTDYARFPPPIIFWTPRVRPLGGHPHQSSLFIFKINAIFSPVLPMGNQIVLPSAKRMIRMGDPDHSSNTVQTSCSCRFIPTLTPNGLC